MGKKTVVLWIVMGLLLSILLTGCGPMGQIRNVVDSSKGRNSAEGEEAASGDADGNAAGGIEDNANSNDDTADNAKEAGETVSEVPVLGAENAHGYDGFEYLYEDTLTAYAEEDKNGRVKRKAVTVYIPDGDVSCITGDILDTAYADTMGVLFYFSLNPYQIDGKEKNSLEGKLQEYVDWLYKDENGREENAYETCYEDIEISKPKKLGQDAVSITVKYCLFDEWDKEYSVFYCTYCLKQLEPDLLALLEVEIDSREVTSETPELLEEIEAFYEVDLGWDSQKAQEKLENRLAYIEENGRPVGILEFRFPEGWEIDDSYSGEDTTIYAPGGDSDGAGCGIGIVYIYTGSETEELMGWLGGEEDMRDYIEEAMAEGNDDFSLQKVEDYGETYIGETRMMEFVYSEEGEMADCRMYIGAKDDYIYIMVAMQYQWLEMNTFDVAEDLLEDGKA